MEREKPKLDWWFCPVCRKKLFMVEPGAVIVGMKIKCRGCRKVINVSL
jgi:hypothetical protein